MRAFKFNGRFQPYVFQVLFDLEFMLRYFLLELLLPLSFFLLVLFVFWYLQARLVLRVYYGTVLPELRRNGILYGIFGNLAVASHEILGHALVSALTGSTPTLHTAITPEHAEVRIAHRRTAWGYLSAVLATLAPCFMPPLVLLAIFAILFPDTLYFDDRDPGGLLYTLYYDAANILDTLFNSSLANPSVLVIFLLAPIFSLTAGASKVDFRIVIQQSARYWYFLGFLLLFFSASLEMVRALLGFSHVRQVFYPIIAILLLSFFVVLLGLTIALMVTAYLSAMRGLPRWQKLLSFLAFPTVYAAFLYYSPAISPFYLAAFIASSLASVVLLALLRLLPRVFRRPRAPPEALKRLRRK